MKTFWFGIVVVLAVTFFSNFSNASARTVANVGVPGCGEVESREPAAVPSGTSEMSAYPARSDTVSFGFYDPSTGYAVLGESWTWDHGAADPLEGWRAEDQTENAAAYFRRITADGWAGHGNEPPVPLLAGQASVWLGAFEDEADALCWANGLGYGDNWCQRLVSPALQYSGTGGITLRLQYFSDSELNFDYTKIFLDKGATSILLNGDEAGGTNGFSGQINIDCTPLPCVVSLPLQPWARAVTAAEMGQAGSFTIRIQFEDDGAWSDEDGHVDSALGPVGIDDVQITGGASGFYDFEEGVEGWTPGVCPPVGSFFAVHPISQYQFPDPCRCRLSGNVIAFHDGNQEHPDGQRVIALSNVVDRRDYLDYTRIIGDWDLYGALPSYDGVLYRAGWSYYPYICPATGEVGWSGLLGEANWHGEYENECLAKRVFASDAGVPADCQYIRFGFEIWADCAAFGIPPTQCTGNSNFSPIFDNVRLRMTRAALAPAIAFNVGGMFQDGFPMGEDLETNATGNANTVRDLNMQNETLPDKLGDSLSIVGPGVPEGAPRWESRLYLRVKREGPAQRTIPRYNTWLERVSDGLNIVGANAPFTYGWMDSVQTAFVQKNGFCSQFHERDDDFAPGAPGNGYDQGEDNEIIWDGIFTPGTKIEYFIAANYTCTPTEMYLLPDTSGGSWYEFEILPSYRWAATGVARFPCVLYVEASGPAQPHIERALNGVLAGAGPESPLPDPAPWDLYNYSGSCSCIQAPFFRGLPGSNNGATLPQLLGYRVILINSGGSGAGVLEPRDWSGLAEWLDASDCGANAGLQGLILSGDNMGEAIRQDGLGLLRNYLGADLVCPDYSEPGCPPNEPENDENPCVRLEYAPGGPWAPSIPTDVFGNWCPTRYPFDVLQTFGSGVGNKVYSRIGTGHVTEFAQITNDRSGPPSGPNYRSVLSGFSHHHATARDLADPGPGTECPNDAVSIFQAARDDLRQSIRWTLNIENPLALGLCEDPCLPLVTEVEGEALSGPVNRLEQNRPNPFNPRTAIRYSLAANGPAKLVIFDVQGRLVKTLVNSTQPAGPHEAVWDGTDDSGHAVGSGIYWSQLSAGDYRSSRKLVIMK